MRHVGLRYVSLFVFVCLAGLPAPAHAGTVTIANYNFASPSQSFGGYSTNIITSWTVVTDPVGVSWSNELPGSYADQTGYVNPGGEFYQDVGPLVANSTYTFSVEVGQREDIGLPTYNIQLLDAGNTSIVLASGIPSAPGSYNFVDFTLMFDSASFSSSVGDNIRIEFSAASSINPLLQVNFADVTLSYAPDQTPPSGTPEPSSFGLTLLGIGVLGIACRKWFRGAFSARS